MLPRMRVKKGVNTTKKVIAILRPNSQPAFDCGGSLSDYMETPSLMKIERFGRTGCNGVCGKASFAHLRENVHCWLWDD